MLCGGLGLVIASVLFFRWRSSETKWKRTVAVIAGAWAGLSVVVHIGIGALYLLGEYTGSGLEQLGSVYPTEQSVTMLPVTPRAYVPEESDMPSSFIYDSSESQELPSGRGEVYTVIYTDTDDPAGEDAELVQFAVAVTENETDARSAFNTWWGEDEAKLEPFELAVAETDESMAHVEREEVEGTPIESLYVVFRKLNCVAMIRVSWFSSASPETAVRAEETQHYIDLIIDRLAD
jgi:hypothetical protein